MEKYKKYIIIPLFVVLVGAGCAKTTTPPQNGNPGSSAGQNSSDNGNVAEHDDHADAEHLATLAGSRIDLENRNSLKPGNVSFRFKLYGLDGHEFGANELKIAHEKKMHFLLVRDDMTGFQHLHPEYMNGKWEVATTVADTGAYQLYVDIEPTEENPVVLRVPITIGGPTAVKQFPAPTSDQSAEAGGYVATLKTTGLKTHEHATLTYEITKNGQPVTTIDPYLGAYGHVVLLRHNDPDDFFHVHPITETTPVNGAVQFEAQFPVNGRYTLYAQFNIDGGVRTFPITVDVNEEGEDTDTTHGHGDESPAPAVHHGS